MVIYLYVHGPSSVAQIIVSILWSACSATIVSLFSPKGQMSRLVQNEYEIILHHVSVGARASVALGYVSSKNIVRWTNLGLGIWFHDLGATHRKGRN